MIIEATNIKRILKINTKHHETIKKSIKGITIDRSGNTFNKTII